MGIEIERKFLLPQDFKIDLRLLDAVNNIICNYDIIQGYIFKTPWKNVRVRVIRDLSRSFPVSTGYITIKNKSDLADLSTSEFEYEIPVDDAYELLKICESKITKNRTTFLINKQKIEVDYFTGRHQGLVIAEIEYESEESANMSIVPEFLTEDVTADKRFANTWLASATDNEFQELMKEVYEH